MCFRRLCQIAFSQPNDAVALACGQQYGNIENLDLAAVAEFKRKEEQIEVKFLDRVRALQVLGELLNGTESNAEDTARDFFRALELSGERQTGESCGMSLQFSEKQKKVITYGGVSPLRTIPMTLLFVMALCEAEKQCACL